MIDAQQITTRMLRAAQQYRSVSANGTPGKPMERSKLVHKYLVAFGITGLPGPKDSGYPPVFRPKHALEWSAYIGETHSGSLGGITEDAYLRTLLDFLRYMQHMGLNPFIRAIEPPTAARTAAKFSIIGTNTALLAATLRQTASEILALVRKTHLLTSMSPVGKAATEVRKLNGVPTLCCSFNLRPRRRKQSLDEVLSTFQGFLYRSAEAPQALLPQWVSQVPGSKSRPKSKLLSVKQLSARTTTIGSLILAKRPDFQVVVQRSRDDTLVLSMLLPLATSDITHFGHKMHQVVKTQWAAAIADFK